MQQQQLHYSHNRIKCNHKVEELLHASHTLSIYVEVTNYLEHPTSATASDARGVGTGFLLDGVLALVS
jgi:hypothetical protein